CPPCSRCSRRATSGPRGQRWAPSPAGTGTSISRAPRPPRYQNPALAISPRYAELDRTGQLHFAPELLRAIHATPGQELGTHTFSHVLMREPGVTADDITADLGAVSCLWRERFGAPPVSLVFPRNQVAFLPVIRACGIRAWRGHEPGWY